MKNVGESTTKESIMKKLITPIVLILCPMLVLAGCATNNTAPVASNGGIRLSAKELGDPNRAKVISRLEKVGYSKEEAIARVDEMTDAEIAYFGEHPESIKRSGFILIASSIGSSVYSTIKASQKKKAAELQKKRDAIASIERDVSRKQKEQDTEIRLLEQEQDPAKRQERKAAIERLGNEIKSLEMNIHSAENDLKSLTDKKKDKEGQIQSKKDKIAFIEGDVSRKQKEQDIEIRLLKQEQDPAKIQERKAAIEKLGNEIKLLGDHINLLENEIKSLEGPKKK